MSAIAWIALAVLFLAVFFFFKSRKFRGFILLTAFAAVLGMLFGPPSYVVHTDYTTTLRDDASGTRYHYAWAINKLAPTEAKRARVGLYNPTTNEFRRFNDDLAKSANLAFVPPTGASWLLHIWWWIFPATYLAFFIQRKFGGLSNLGGILYFPRRNRLCQEQLDIAREHGTVWAYEKALKFCQDYRWPPRKIVEIIQHEHQAIFQTYRQRVQTLERLYRNAGSTLQERDASAYQRYGKLYLVANFMHLINRQLSQRETQRTAGLALDIQVQEGWYSYTGPDNELTKYDSLNALERAKLAEFEQRWGALGVNAFTLRDITEKYASERISFAAIRQQLSKVESAQEFVNEQIGQFLAFVEQLLHGTLTEQQQPIVRQLAHSYFIQRLFQEVSDRSQDHVFHRSFAKQLRHTLATIMSAYFPEESKGGQGTALFSDATLANPEQQQLQFHLLPVGRLTSGAPTIEATVFYRVNQHQVWRAGLRQPQLPSNFKASADAFGHISATAMLRDTFNTRQNQVPPSRQSVSEQVKQDILDELNETMKELAQGAGEDLALELINQIIAGNGSNAILQFEAAVDSEMSTLVFESLEHAASLLEAGLSLFGGDD